MSTASLPSYHYEPQESEQRLAQRLRAHRPQSSFVKISRSGGLILRLSGQRDDATLPEYGRGAFVEGTVELRNVDSVQAVEVKIEGALRLKEIAEGGTNTSSLCLDVKRLWSEVIPGPCPSSFSFSLTLPTTYFDGKTHSPLPPAFEAHLSGVPGFNANIDYSVSATVVRRKVSLFGLANITVSTPFIYRPRSRPAVPLPGGLTTNFTHPSAIQNEDWTAHQATMKVKSTRGDDIVTKLYIPSSHVFSITDAIPFHLFLLSSAFSLATFLPLAPVSSPAPSPPTSATYVSASNPIITLPNSKQQPGITRIQLLRQTAVDVRSISKRAPLLRGNNTDIWKTVQIGEGVFRRYGSTTNGTGGLGGGQDWMGWYGEIRVDPNVKIGGFKASGLTVKDFIVLSMNPPDPGKSPFTDMRLVVPIKLTTDPWSFDDVYIDVAGYSDPDLDHVPTELGYAM